MTEEQGTTRAFPLWWPEGWPRTEPGDRKWSRFKDHTVYRSRMFLAKEILLFEATDLIISSNLELRQDGNPRDRQRQPADPGVAIFFKRNGIDMALACDVYTTVEDNLWALCRTLEALRQIERDGSPALINRAFKGFKALQDPDQLEWWQVLGIARTASDEEIRAAYIRLAKQHHPDHGGDAAIFDQVAKAFNLAMGRTKL